MRLRYYQQNAVNSIIRSFRDGENYILADMATASGKSLVIAELAKIAKGRVLCIQPSKELCEQNYEKYIINGGRDMGYYSASVGKKDGDKKVIFGTIQTIENGIKLGLFKDISLVIFDECHEQTQKGIDIAIQLNSKVLGLTATPYRLNTGYIFKESPSLRAYYTKCAFKYSSKEALNDGFNSKVVIEPPLLRFDTSKLKLKPTGDFNLSDDEALSQNIRLTEKIISHVVQVSVDKKGVMIFGQTVKHCEEILSYLPSNEALFISSLTKKKDRIRYIDDFKAMKYKYIVCIQTLTTGFDAPHVDLLAILRPTTSISLIQQIIGRGVRISPETNKTQCTVIDYAGNIDRLYTDGDIFLPIIETVDKKRASKKDICCPVCDTVQKAAMKPNIDGWKCTTDGYWVDDNQNKIESSHFKPKCEKEDCEHFWTFRECKKCLTKNTLTTRYCTKCEAELVDPNKKLGGEDVIENNIVKEIKASKHTAKSSNQMLKISARFVDNKVSSFFVGKWNISKLKLGYNQDHIINNISKIKSIDYFKNKKGYNEIIGVRHAS